MPHFQTSTVVSPHNRQDDGSVLRGSVQANG